MNPFDLKTVILDKPAQHVALVHFPIALLRAAYCTVIAAAIAAVPTVATGLLAWHSINH